MRKAYRISVTKDKKKNQKNAYAVYVPDFKIYTEGRDKFFKGTAGGSD